MNFNFENSLKLLLTAMRIVLNHPDIPINSKWLLKYLFSYGVFSFISLVVVYNLYFNITQTKELLKICETGIISMTYFGANLNNVIMFYYRDSVKNLLNMMRNDYKQASDYSVEEQKIFGEYVKKQEAVCKGWAWVLILTLSLFNIKSLCLMAYYAYIGEPRLIHLFDLVYPDVIEKRKNDLDVFIFIYFCIFWYGIYGVLIYLSFLPFGPVLMLHACGHLEISKKRIETLFNNDSKDVNEKLVDIIKILQYTYDLVEIMNQCFQMFYEITLKISALALPLTFYALIESVKRGEFSMEFTSFIISGIAISSAPCYYSDLLLAKGEEVRLALYTCGWELVYNRRARSSILFLLTRCSRPVAMRTVLTTLCLDALTDMFQQAYTIFNLMNAALD